MNVEGRERFFRAIAERIDVERVEEVHVFPAIRQGGRESGVAVLTLQPLPPESEGAGENEEAHDRTDVAEVEETDGGTRAAENAEIVDFADVAELADAAVVAETGEGENPVDAEAADGADAVLDATAESVELPPTPQRPHRFTVLRAHYRLQLKGPDRGKWEVGVVEEADAPAATVDEVVRGVHERAGGWSVEGPERLTGDEFRAALAEEPWSATR